MNTVKMSKKQIMELDKFTAVSNAGRVVEFVIEGDKAVNQETGKKVSPDTIRRSWEIVIEEEQENEIASTETSQHTDNNEEQIEVEEEKEVTIEKADKVKLVDGTVGIVTDIVNDLATVKTDEDDIPVQVESLELVEKNVAEELLETQMAEVVAEVEETQAEQSEAKVEKKATEKKASTVSTNKREQLLDMLESVRKAGLTNMKTISKSKSYLAISSGISSAKIVITPRKNDMKIELSIKGEKKDEIFNNLQEHDEVIAQETGLDFEWDNKEGRKSAKIRYTAQTEDINEWTVEMAKLFKETFSKYLK